jgi:hypothetical protein
MEKIASKQIAPTPTIIPMIRPALLFLLLGGLLLTVGTKSVQV